MIDLTLDSLTVPGIPDYIPPFGTQKDPLVSLSTVETNNNIIKPFTAQRAVEFSHDETLSRIERNAILVYTGDADAVLDMSDVTTFKGNEIKIVNTTSHALTVKYLEVGEVSYSTTILTENSETLIADSTTTYSVKVSIKSESITTLWSGTKEQFDAIPVKDSNTLYNIIDDVDEELIQDEETSPLSTWSSQKLAGLVYPAYDRLSSGKFLYPACQTRPNGAYYSYRGSEENWELAAAGDSTWKSLVLKAGTPIPVFENNRTCHIFYSDDEVTISAANLVSGDAFAAGTSYYVYLVYTDQGNWLFKISTSDNQTFAGALAKRIIGGFDTLCVSVTSEQVYSTTEVHPFSGAVAGYIHPFSVWDLWHRPVCCPEGFAYVPTLGIWASIYLMSKDATLNTWTTGTTSSGSKYPNDSFKMVSKNGGTILDGASTPALDCLDGEQQLHYQGMRLPTIGEFGDLARGAPQGVNINSSVDPITTGGHVATNSKRIISYCGLEDIVGVLWQWSSESSYDASESITWTDNFSANKRDVLGQYYFGAGKRALLGGSWDNGAFCGSRCLGWDFSPLSLDDSIGFRAVSESMHK